MYLWLKPTERLTPSPIPQMQNAVEILLFIGIVLFFFIERLYNKSNFKFPILWSVLTVGLIIVSLINQLFME